MLIVSLRFFFILHQSSIEFSTYFNHCKILPVYPTKHICIFFDCTTLLLYIFYKRISSLPPKRNWCAHKKKRYASSIEPSQARTKGKAHFRNLFVFISLKTINVYLNYIKYKQRIDIQFSLILYLIRLEKYIINKKLFKVSLDIIFYLKN